MPHQSTAERIGRREGRRDVLIEQMEEKFGPLAEDVATRVDCLTQAQVTRYLKRILTANTLDELGLSR